MGPITPDTPPALKERQTKNWTKDVRRSAAGEIKVVRCLKPERESQRILDGNRSPTIVHSSVEWSLVIDEKTVLDVVIVVETHASGEGKIALDTPAIIDVVFKLPGRPHCLREEIVEVLSAPGADVFAERGHLEILAELVLQSHGSGRREEFANDRIKFEIANVITS